MNFPLIVYDELSVSALTRRRTGEVKLGEKVLTLPWGSRDQWQQALSDCPARYVLLGLPEDIGVRANLGRGGAYSAWQPALATLMNIQSNVLFTGEELLVLGHIDFSAGMEKASDLDFQKSDDLRLARELVSEIDEAVTSVICSVVAAGKEAIVIGGGHNNAYGCIKGSSLAESRPMACINCDAHSDLRPLEGRHSGNAFSYALEEGWLNRYAMLGLHEIFNMASVMERIDQDERLDASFFEDIFIRELISFSEAIQRAINFAGNQQCGLELDLDTIQNIPSSAKTSSGISSIQARQFVHRVATECDLCYFHIAEAAPVLSHIKTDLKTGKLIAYLVSDYIKARNRRHETID
jgi:formiminoglutamase